MTEPGYKKLLVWKIADELARKAYLFTKDFPPHEIYGLTSQLRRASLSVVLNIIEGYSRNGKKEFRQFLRIALGSLAEVEYLIDFAVEQGYIKQEDKSELIALRARCGQLLWRLFKSLD